MSSSSNSSGVSTGAGSSSGGGGGGVGWPHPWDPDDAVTSTSTSLPEQLVLVASDSRLSIEYTVCEVVVALVAAIGNTLVCIGFVTDRRLRKQTNYYILSLALADLLVGVLGIPVAILASVGLPRQLEACLVSISVLLILCTVSIFSLLAVSFDRFWAIMFPLKYGRIMSGQLAIGIIVGCWLLGTFIGLLPVMGWNSGPYPSCMFTKVMDYDYLVFLYFATIVFPGVLMAAFYIRIYIVVVRQVRTMSFLSCLPEDVARRRTRSIYRGQISGKEIRAAKNLSIIVLFFMICWFPLYTINCVNAFCPDCHVPLELINFTIVLSHANSAINPLLYAYNLRDFRRALYTLVCVRLLRVASTHETPDWFRAKVLAQEEAVRRAQLQRAERIRPRTRSEPPYRPQQRISTVATVVTSPALSVPSPLHQRALVMTVMARGVLPEVQRLQRWQSCGDLMQRWQSCGNLLQLEDLSWSHVTRADNPSPTSSLFRQRLKSSGL